MYMPNCDEAKAFICESKWPFAIVDTEGKFLWLNRAYCEVFNAPQELIIGTRFQQWTHPDDIEIDTQLAAKVASGELPGYTLSKKYIQRGSTPTHPRIVWGLLSVTGVWTDGKFAGYRVQFRQYESTDIPQRMTLRETLKTVSDSAQWLTANWKTVTMILAIVMSLIYGSSAKLLDTLQRALEAKQSVESLSDALSPGALPVQP